MDKTLAPALRRLPQYIYLADLLRGRRVLEIGSGDGAAAAFLARAGASHVIGVDRFPALVEAARGKHRLQNLSFIGGEYGALEVEDRSIDAVLVGSGATTSGAELVRWLGFLEEVRRVLAKSGNLVLAAPSGDRTEHPGARAGISYHELVQRLEPLFGRVRMVGVSPFLGLSLVEFSDDEEIGELELDTQLTSLGSGRDPVTDYVAVTGPVPENWGKARGFVVVELPGAEGMVAVAQSRGEVGPDGERTREAERVAEGAMARLKELEAAASSARERSAPPDPELRRRFARALEEKTAAESETIALRGRLAQADQEIGRVAAQAARELLEARREVEIARSSAPVAAPAPPAGPSPELVAEVNRLGALLRDREAALAETHDKHQAAAAGAEAHVAAMRAKEGELAEKHELAEELEREVGEAQAAAQRASTEAREAAARVAELDGELRDARSKVAVLEGEKLKIDPRVAELQQQLDEKTAADKKATERWKLAEAKTDELWRKVGEMQKELETSREQAVENARAARQASQIALTRAVDEASKKLVSVKDELARAARETKDLEAKHAEADGRAKSHAARAGELEKAIAEHAAKAAELARTADTRAVEHARITEELESAKIAHAGELAVTQQANAEELARLKDTYAAELATAQQAHAAELATAQQAHAAELAAARQAHAGELDAAKQAHAGELAVVRNAHVGALGAAKQVHATEVGAMRDELANARQAHSDEVGAVRDELANARQAHADEVGAVRGEVDSLRADLAAAGAASMDAEGELAARDRALTDAREEVEHLRVEVKRLDSEIERAQSALASAQAALGEASAAKEDLARVAGELEQAKTQSVMLAAEVEMVRGDLSAELDTHRAAAAEHAARAEEHGARARDLEGDLAHLAADRDRARAQLARQETSSREALARLVELDRLVGGLVGQIETEEARAAELERAIGAVVLPTPAPSPTEAPWGAAQARIRKLSAELGERDAELLLLHATVATAKKRLSEIVDTIKAARASQSGEVAALLDKLAAEASALT